MVAALRSEWVTALRSEWVTAFKSEYPVGFIGIRDSEVWCRIRLCGLAIWARRTEINTRPRRIQDSSLIR
jgi:hypothetical protein